MRRSLCLIVFCFILASGYVFADFESDVIDLVNVERAAQGLHPLSYDHQLAAAARDHSEDMGLQGYFSHTSLDGRTVPAPRGRGLRLGDRRHPERSLGRSGKPYACPEGAA